QRRKRRRCRASALRAIFSLDSGLFDLTELQFHRGRTPEDQHGHAQAALLVVDFLDHAVEIVERALGDAHHLARLEQHLRLGLLDALAHATENGVGFAVLDRQRAIGGAADEPHDLGGFLDQVPALVVDAWRLALGAALDLHQHVAELLFHPGALDALLERTLDLVLEARIGVHHVPALAHAHLNHPASTASRG